MPRSRAKRGPKDLGMWLAKQVARWQPAGRRMKTYDKLTWRRHQLQAALSRHGIPWRQQFYDVLADARDREVRRSDHARYVRAYGTSRDRSRKRRRRSRSW